MMQQLTQVGSDLSVMTLDAGLEQQLHNILQQSKEHGLAIEPNLAEQLLGNLQDTSERLAEQGIPPVLVVSPGIRPWLAKMVKKPYPRFSHTGLQRNTRRTRHSSGVDDRTTAPSGCASTSRVKPKALRLIEDENEARFSQRHTYSSCHD